MQNFFIGSAGVYYQAEGYEPGLYKVDDQGRNINLIDDNFYDILLTDTGIVYTLRYQDGIYLAK
ncbi:hypothetical protein [Dehalobacterium formicoaceticum]|uniref:Uncharacterized protein n=1 Tax=Dehalobacterium formicoaceticum TaxID=51515 RepID=A0ABT1Y4A1_9FIRM|nr:hypothetical protein [Dehalobacterium formicoaceticum]MCR6545699.1 hypothetical protein [Dehalobacterium formicoaceticum]